MYFYIPGKIQKKLRVRLVKVSTPKLCALDLVAYCVRLFCHVYCRYILELNTDWDWQSAGILLSTLWFSSVL